MIDKQTLSFTRTLRTSSSERFLVHAAKITDVDIAAIEVHYLDNGVVAVTVIILSDEHTDDDFVKCLIETIDLRMLPMACISEGDLNLTVVAGRVLGQFVNDQAAG